MKFVARFLSLILVVIGFIGLVAMYSQWHIAKLNNELLANQPTQASQQPEFEALQRKFYQEQLLYRELLLGAVVTAAFIGALLINVTRKPIAALNAKAQKLESSNNELTKNLEAQNQQLAYQAGVAESERSKYEAILYSLADGMLITDISGNIVLVNMPALKILGYKDDCIHGKPAYDIAQLYDDKDQIVPEEKHPLYVALKHGQKSVADVVIRMPETEIKKVVRISATVIRNKNTTIGAVASLQDITHETQVDRMKTDFISLASHQLRTPLSAIRWFSEMLYNGDVGELRNEQRDYTKNIVDSTLRMIELVSGLLNISRMESGRIIIDPKPTDLNQLIGGIVDELKLKILEKQHHIKIAIHKDVQTLNVDPQLIRQVYINFLTNAIKYTPRGGEISVTVWRKDDMVISQISDTGYGIPKAAQAKIFQKFFRAANVAKIETDGTGLGMYLVRSIITAAGGKIWMHSEEGKGTTFWFSLPAEGMKKREGEVSLDG